jgi:FkbM family methyltransferase
MSAFGHYITRRYLTRASREHLAQYPQLACFSFDLITHFIHLDGQYERDELALLAARVFPRLPAGGTCLDVGANIGNHSLHFARHFARVIAFEPHPRTFRLLDLNAELAPNVTALNLGASDAAGTVTITEDRQNLAASGIGRAGGDGGKSVAFKLERIDDLPQVAQAGPITFIKFDVEGHERQAIDGARATIQRHKPLIMLEVLPGEIADGTARSVEALREMGYGHFYEAVEAGALGTLPRPLRKIARALKGLFTGRRPGKADRLRRVDRLEARSYLMLLCATAPLPGLD